MQLEKLNVVAIGGGHGLGRVLSTLSFLRKQLTGIVTTTDNGGSTGRLRKRSSSIAWGDLRNCLTLLVDKDSVGSQLFDFRFDGQDELGGHNLANEDIHDSDSHHSDTSNHTDEDTEDDNPQQSSETATPYTGNYKGGLWNAQGGLAAKSTKQQAKLSKALKILQHQDFLILTETHSTPGKARIQKELLAQRE